MLLPFPAHDVIPHLHDNVGQTDPQCCSGQLKLSPNEGKPLKKANRALPCDLL